MWSRRHLSSPSIHTRKRLLSESYHVLQEDRDSMSLPEARIKKHKKLSRSQDWLSCVFSRRIIWFLSQKVSSLLSSRRKVMSWRGGRARQQEVKDRLDSSPKGNKDRAEDKSEMLEQNLLKINSLFFSSERMQCKHIHTSFFTLPSSFFTLPSSCIFSESYFPSVWPPIAFKGDLLSHYKEVKQKLNQESLDVVRASCPRRLLLLLYFNDDSDTWDSFSSKEREKETLWTRIRRSIKHGSWNINQHEK